MGTHRKTTPVTSRAAREKREEIRETILRLRGDLDLKLLAYYDSVEPLLRAEIDDAVRRLDHVVQEARLAHGLKAH